MTRRLLPSSLAALLVGAVTWLGVANAAPPPPSFTPGFPVRAGEMVMLMWMPSAGAVKYHVYLNDKKVHEQEAAMQPYNHPLPPDATGQFRFSVTAVDAAGKESPRSKEGVITVVKLLPPTAMDHMARGRAVMLRWKAPAGAVIFNVYKSQKQDDSNPELVASVQTANYTDPGVSEGQTYYYWVSSKDLSGAESTKSAPYEVKVEKLEVVARKEEAARTYDDVALLRKIAIPSESLPQGFQPVGMTDYWLDPATGEFYVADDANSVVWRLDNGGTVLGYWGRDGSRAPFARLVLPKTLTGSANFVFVWSVKEGDVLKYDKEGGFVKRMNLALTEEERKTSRRQLSTVRLFADEGTLYLTDGLNMKIRLYDFEGNRKGVIEGEKLGMGLASGICATPQGTLCVIETFTPSVTLLKKGGQEVETKFGAMGSNVGQFQRPQDVGVDPQGRIYVSDIMSHVVQVFDPETKDVVTVIGATEKEDDQFSVPGRSVFYKDRVYVLSAGKSRIHEYQWRR